MATPKTARQFQVLVNTKYCKGCNICVQACPRDVLFLTDRTRAAVQSPAACTGCLACEIYCPDFAIVVEEVAALA